MTRTEDSAIRAAHLALSQAVDRFEDAAYALAGPVPGELQERYADALSAAVREALPPYCGPRTTVRVTSAYRRALAGLRGLANESLAAFPTRVEPDEVRPVSVDWTIPEGWA